MATHALRSDGTERSSYIINIDNLTSSDLRKAAGNYLSKDGYVLISITPKKNKK